MDVEAGLGCTERTLGVKRRAVGSRGGVQPVPELVQQYRESIRPEFGGVEERRTAGGHRLCGITSSS